MARTRVSPKYQVVIPKEVRESLGLKVGQELQVVTKSGTITLVPERPLCQIGVGKLPMFVRILETFQEASALLFFPDALLPKAR